MPLNLNWSSFTKKTTSRHPRLCSNRQCWTLAPKRYIYLDTANTARTRPEAVPTHRYRLERPANRQTPEIQPWRINRFSLKSRTNKQIAKGPHWQAQSSSLTQSVATQRCRAASLHSTAVAAPCYRWRCRAYWETETMTKVIDPSYMFI